jgi:hypothetical protein
MFCRDNCITVLSISPRGTQKIQPLGSKGGRWVLLPTLPPSRTDCLESMRASISWSPKGLYMDSCTYKFHLHTLQLREKLKTE